VLRAIGEAQVVAAADRLIASTSAEAGQLVDLYAADPGRVATVAPGVDLDVFTPADRAGARARLGLAADAVVLLFVGRIQPLKAPDVLLHAASELLAFDSALRDRLVVAVVGGPSGTGMNEPEHLHKLAGDLGIADVVRFERPGRTIRYRYERTRAPAQAGGRSGYRRRRPLRASGATA
jgi:D-inositol-3-phosphate glycosyltransferase